MRHVRTARVRRLATRLSLQILVNTPANETLGARHEIGPVTWVIRAPLALRHDVEQVLVRDAVHFVGQIGVVVVVVVIKMIDESGEVGGAVEVVDEDSRVIVREVILN